MIEYNVMQSTKLHTATDNQLMLTNKSYRKNTNKTP